MRPNLVRTLSNVPSNKREASNKNDEINPKNVIPHTPNSMYVLLYMVLDTASLWPFIKESAKIPEKFLWSDAKIIDEMMIINDPIKTNSGLFTMASFIKNEMHIIMKDIIKIIKPAIANPESPLAP